MIVGFGGWRKEDSLVAAGAERRLLQGRAARVPPESDNSLISMVALGYAGAGVVCRALRAVS